MHQIRIQCAEICRHDYTQRKGVEQPPLPHLARSTLDDVVGFEQAFVAALFPEAEYGLPPAHQHLLNQRTFERKDQLCMRVFLMNVYCIMP